MRAMTASISSLFVHGNAAAGGGRGRSAVAVVAPDVVVDAPVVMAMARDVVVTVAMAVAGACDMALARRGGFVPGRRAAAVEAAVDPVGLDGPLPGRRLVGAGLGRGRGRRGRRGDGRGRRRGLG